MKRRSFIKNGLLAAGALSLPLTKGKMFAAGATGSAGSTGATGATGGAQAPGGFKKSIMWGTVAVEGSVLDKCKAVKEAGYEGVEVNGQMNRQEVTDAARAAGLVVSGVVSATHWRKPLSHPDAAVRQEGIDGALAALEDARAYGTDALLLVPGLVNETVSYDECWARSVEGIRKLLPAAEKLKVSICVENVWNNFLLSPMEACRYVDQFNSPWVKFYFDTGNIMIYGWPEQWIRILGDRIGRVHIKEFSKDIADKRGRRAGFDAPLTEGSVDWPKVLGALRASYKNTWLTTEQKSGKTTAELKDLGARFDKLLAMG